MLQVPEVTGIFETPTVFFTLANATERGLKNPKSAGVVNELTDQFNGNGVRCIVFNSESEIEQFFEQQASSRSAVVFLDHSIGGKHFHPTCRSRGEKIQIPPWTHGAHWIVLVGEKCDAQRCARQVHADFGRRFNDQISKKGQFPWGIGKMVNGQREMPPVPVVLPATIQETVSQLNSGPNLAEAIADQAFAAELPIGSRISWLRIAPKPIDCDAELLKRIVRALSRFERVSNALVREDQDVQKILLSGVDLPEGSPLSVAYLFPQVDHFSVSRPDLHYTGKTTLPYASEIDEMPGGMPELVHIDQTYGVNDARWKKAFNWLCEDGTLLFLVSHEWSKCYIPETKWLVEHLQKLGYPVDMLTTDRLEELEFREDSFFFNGKQVGTIWRQFPIFETKGRLAEIVMAAYEGKVRIIPEFAHFGNKAWFSVFRSHEAFYRSMLDQEEFELLDAVLPHSHIIGGVDNEAFPFTLQNGTVVQNIADLESLPQETRDYLVLKICGANNLAARSYGVLMGKGIPADDWQAWIKERMRANQPFVVQRRLESGILRLPVLNVKSECPELFSCRVLARPWVFNGELISMHGCAVPSCYFKVHGMVDMAVLAFAI